MENSGKHTYPKSSKTCTIHSFPTLILYIFSLIKYYLTIIGQIFQRDMAERGHSLESIKASIDARKPDFEAYIGNQELKVEIILSFSV